MRKNNRRIQKSIKKFLLIKIIYDHHNYHHHNYHHLHYRQPLQQQYVLKYYELEADLYKRTEAH